MKKILFISLLFSASLFALEPRSFFQYLPVTPFFPAERPSRDYLRLEGPYAPWRATAPAPVWTEVTLYRERVDEMRKLEDTPPPSPQSAPTVWGLESINTNIIISVPDIGLGRRGQTVDDPTVIDTDWFYIPKNTTSKPTSQPTLGSSSEFNKTPIPLSSDGNQPPSRPQSVIPSIPTPPKNTSNYNQPDERVP